MLIFSTGIKAEIVNYNQFVEQAWRNHPISKIDQQTYLSQLASAKQLKAVSDWNLFAAATKQTGLLNSSFGSYSKNGELTSLTGSIQKVFTQIGTKLQIESNYSSMTKIPAISGFNIPDIYQSNINISIREPLLRDGFGKISRYPIFLSDQQQIIANIKYKEDKEDFQGHLTQSYLNWQYEFNKLRISKEQLETAKKQLISLEKQYKRGFSEKSELNLSKQHVLAKKITYQQQLAQYEETLLSIQHLINGKATILNKKLMPQTELIHFDISENKKDRIKTGRIYQLLEVSLVISKKTMDVAKNNQLPQLDLFATQTYNAIQTSKSDAIQRIGENAPLTIGLQFSRPLHNTQTQQEAVKTKAEYNKAVKDIALKKESLIVQIEQLFNQKKWVEEWVVNTKELISIVEESAQLENKKYKQGRSNMQFVLQAQDQVLGAQLQYETFINMQQQLNNQLMVLLDFYEK